MKKPINLLITQALHGIKAKKQIGIKLFKPGIAFFQAQTHRFITVILENSVHLSLFAVKLPTEFHIGLLFVTIRV